MSYKECTDIENLHNEIHKLHNAEKRINLFNFVFWSLCALAVVVLIILIAYKNILGIVPFIIIALFFIVCVLYSLDVLIRRNLYQNIWKIYDISI